MDVLLRTFQATKVLETICKVLNVSEAQISRLFEATTYFTFTGKTVQIVARD